MALFCFTKFVVGLGRFLVGSVFDKLWGRTRGLRGSTHERQVLNFEATPLLCPSLLAVALEVEELRGLGPGASGSTHGRQVLKMLLNLGTKSPSTSSATTK